jgi:hypothetical protein
MESYGYIFRTTNYLEVHYMYDENEHRKSSRVAKEIETLCRTYLLKDELVEVSPPMPLTIMNISEFGVNIRSKDQLTLNATLAFDLEFGLSSHKVLATVRWSNEEGDHFISGLEFQSVPQAFRREFEEMKDLL